MSTTPKKVLNKYNPNLAGTYLNMDEFIFHWFCKPEKKKEKSCYLSIHENLHIYTLLFWC